MGISTVRKHKLLHHHHRLNQFFQSTAWPQLYLGVGVEQPVGCLIIQSRQSMHSMGRSMGWTLKDNMVNGLISFATLAGRRSGHTQFIQTRAETSDINAGVVELDTRCSWQGYSRGLGVDVWDESTESEIKFST